MSDERPTFDHKLALILRTAAAVFAEKGYHQASIRDISRATGVSLSGLYYYVKSKEELLFRIQDRCFATVVANARRLLEPEPDPEERLRLFVENHLRFFAHHMNEMKVLSHEAGSLEEPYRQRVNTRKKEYSDLCMSVLEALRPEESGIDPRVATFSLFGMMNWIYNWYQPERDVPVAELAGEMSRLFLHGLRAPAVAPAGAGRGGRQPRVPSIWHEH